MAISKIIYKANAQDTGTVWMDATPATAAAADITAPKTAMLADGVLTTGTGSGGGGLVYETGTYTPVNDVQKPTINFANTHSTIPVFIMFADATGTYNSTTNSSHVFLFNDWYGMFGTAIYQSSTTDRYAGLNFIRRGTSTTSMSNSYANVTRPPTDTGDTDGSYYGYWVTTSSFVPYTNNASTYWRSGRTYKWIAVWKQST